MGSNSQEYNLQIINVNLDDDAVFQCQIGPATGNPPLLAEAHLQVLGKLVTHHHCHNIAGDKNG